jgi:hypothetical protein
MRRWAVVAVLLACGAGLFFSLTRKQAEPAARTRASSESGARPSRALPTALREHAEPASSTGARSVAGLVLTTRRAPLPGATVCALAEGPSARRVCTVSKASGEFTLEPVGGAPLLLLAAAPGFLSRTLHVPAANAEQPGARLQLVLERGELELAGSVLDGTGGAIPGAWVSARDAARNPVGMARSDAEGRFHLSVPAGRVALSADADAYSSAALIVEAPARDLELVLLPGSTIVGRALAAGVPVSDVEVIANYQGGVAFGWGSARTGVDGAFELDGLPGGTYEVSARSAEWRSDSRMVSIGLGETSETLLLELAPAASLRAHVQVGGEPCSDGHVSLRGEVQRVEPIGADGSVVIEGVPLGEYAAEVVCAAAAPLQEVLQLAVGVATRRWDLTRGLQVLGRVEDAAGQPVAAAPVQVTPLDDSSSATASCVTDAAGEFACGGLLAGEYECHSGAAQDVGGPAVRVSVGPDAPPKVVLRLPASATIRVTLAGDVDTHSLSVLAQQEGRLPVSAEHTRDEFVFERLPLGKYRVFVGANPESGSGSSAQVALEQPGATATLTLSVPALMEISGTVLDAHGAPLVDAWVHASSAAPVLGLFADSPRQALSDDSGRFSLPGLLPGAYDLLATSAASEQRISHVQAGTRDVVFRLPAYASVAGQVRDVQGGLVPSFVVYCAPLAGGPGQQLEGRDGYWSASALPPGRYEISIQSEAGSTTQKVELQPGKRSDLTLQLDRPREPQPLQNSQG